jgi:hypothetical protein
MWNFGVRSPTLDFVHLVEDLLQKREETRGSSWTNLQTISVLDYFFICHIKNPSPSAWFPTIS